MANATLTYRGKSYDVTAEDRLWLLRAVQAEGAVAAQVAQTLCNLFCYLQTTLNASKYPTLTTLVRAYSQPVNPRWYPVANGQGDLHAKALANGQDTEFAAIRRRDLLSKRAVFDVLVTGAVDKALTQGLKDVPRNCTDYAAWHIDGAAKGMTALSEPQKGINRLWTRCTGWTGYEVDSWTLPTSA